MAIEVMFPLFAPFDSTLKNGTPKSKRISQVDNQVTPTLNLTTAMTNTVAADKLTSDNLTTLDMMTTNKTAPITIPGVIVEADASDSFDNDKTGHYFNNLVIGREATSDYESSMNASMVSSSFDSESSSADEEFDANYLRPCGPKRARPRSSSSVCSPFNTSFDSGHSVSSIGVASRSRRVLTWDQIVLESDSALALWEQRKHRRRQPLNPVLKDTLKYVCPVSGCHQDNVSSLMVLPLRRRRSFSDIPTSTSFSDFDTLTDASGLTTGLRRRASLRTSSCDLIVSMRKQLETLRTRSPNGNDSKSDCGLSERTSKQNPTLSGKDGIRTLDPTAHAQQLLRGVKLTNPIYAALQITSIDQGLFLQLDPYELMEVAIGKNTHAYKNDTLGMKSINRLTEFGKQLEVMIITVITREVSAHVQASKIAAFIEVATCLRKLRNWHSLQVIIEAIQSVQIFKLTNSWSILKSKHPVHFNDYLKLVELINKSNLNLLRSKSPCIPSLRAMISLLRIQCSSKLDLLSCTRKWTQRESLIGWLESQLKLSGYQEKLTNDQNPTKSGQQKNGHSKSDRKNRIQVPFIRESPFGGSRKRMESFLPRNDPLHFITMSCLPKNWSLDGQLVSGIDYMSEQQQQKISEWFYYCFKIEMDLFEKYSIFNHDIPI